MNIFLTVINNISKKINNDGKMNLIDGQSIGINQQKVNLFY